MKIRIIQDGTVMGKSIKRKRTRIRKGTKTKTRTRKRSSRRRTSFFSCFLYLLYIYLGFTIHDGNYTFLFAQCYTKIIKGIKIGRMFFDVVNFPLN